MQLPGSVNYTIIKTCKEAEAAICIVEKYKGIYTAKLAGSVLFMMDDSVCTSWLGEAFLHAYSHPVKSFQL